MARRKDGRPRSLGARLAAAFIADEPAELYVPSRLDVLDGITEYELVRVTLNLEAKLLDDLGRHDEAAEVRRRVPKETLQGGPQSSS